MNGKIEIFEEHLKKEERSENTINKYLRDIKEFYNWLDEQNISRGEHCEPAVTKNNLLGYKEHLSKSKLKISSINSKISSLNAYFTYIENESLKIKFIKCQKSLFGSKERELTKNEFNKLYSAAKNNNRFKYLIEAIVKTGIRVSEVKYITVASLKRGKVEVKNKGKIRTILIPRKLCIKLLDYNHKRKHSRNGKLHGTTPRTGELHEPTRTGELYEAIFTTRNGTPINRKQIWQMMKDLAAKAGVPKEKVFPHNLRHLFAREFYKQTHDIVKLASILGHSSIETTRIYTKETEDECRIEIERVMILRE